MPLIRGARPGNRNALKHGRYTAERRAARARLATVLRQARAVLREGRLYLAELRFADPVFDPRV
jgi:hypothetical protein